MLIQTFSCVGVMRHPVLGRNEVEGALGVDRLVARHG